MGQTTHQIEDHIESTRDALGSNLHELEQRVKSVTDWKQQFKKRPLTMVGAAFGGGVFLAAMLGGQKSRRRNYGSGAVDSDGHPATDYHKQHALDTWDNIKGALIGLAAMRVKDLVGEMVPGFAEQFQETEASMKSRYPGR
jgi:hypothetical protein